MLPGFTEYSLRLAEHCSCTEYNLMLMDWTQINTAIPNFRGALLPDVNIIVNLY